MPESVGIKNYAFTYEQRRIKASQNYGAFMRRFVVIMRKLSRIRLRFGLRLIGPNPSARTAHLQINNHNKRGFLRKGGRIRVSIFVKIEMSDTKKIW